MSILLAFVVSAAWLIVGITIGRHFPPKTLSVSLPTPVRCLEFECQNTVEEIVTLAREGYCEKHDRHPPRYYE